jgi:hypothetical protein
MVRARARVPGPVRQDRGHRRAARPGERGTRFVHQGLGNRDSYQLKDPKTLREVVGTPAKHLAPWPEVFDFLLQARVLVSISAERGNIAVAVDANHLLDWHRKRMEILHCVWDKPELAQDQWWSGFVAWVLLAAKQLAAGSVGSALLPK